MMFKGLSVALSAALLCAASIALAQQNTMTFFVTSAGPGKGADLGGLAGADRLCQSLAQAAGAGSHAARLSEHRRGRWDVRGQRARPHWQGTLAQRQRRGDRQGRG